MFDFWTSRLLDFLILDFWTSGFVDFWTFRLSTLDFRGLGEPEGPLPWTGSQGNPSRTHPDPSHPLLWSKVRTPYRQAQLGKKHPRTCKCRSVLSFLLLLVKIMELSHKIEYTKYFLNCGEAGRPLAPFFVARFVKICGLFSFWDSSMIPTRDSKKTWTILHLHDIWMSCL